jgi:hypothetical protein
MRPTRTAALAVAVLLAVGAPAGFAHAQPDPAPVPAPPPAPKTSIDADGTYAVGTDIAPGVYSSAGPVADGACYWKRVSGDKLVDNALTKKPQVVEIQAGDTSFTTNECQPWQLTNAAPPPQAGPGDLLGQLGTFLGPAILGRGPAAPAAPAPAPGG